MRTWDREGFAFGRTAMKLLVSLTILALVGCASMSSARSSNDAQGCSPLESAVAHSDANVFRRPDSTADVVATLRAGTKVCADAGTVGFGFRRVKSADGTVGYVQETNLL